MSNIFNKQKAQADNGEHWLTISDLMAGLMMVFLFIAIAYMMFAQKENAKIKDVAVAYQQNQIDIYDALLREFKYDLEAWQATIDKATLAVNFESPDVLFANNSTVLTKKYQDILNEFFPRYIEILKPFRGSLNEIRIEGHTSSAGLRGSTPAQAYFYNMQLSQRRTRAVLEYCYFLLPDEVDWVRETVAAVGFSSSRPIVVDGVEDSAKSRRVSFRAITNAEIQMKRILESE